MSPQSRRWAIVPAAGQGARFGAALPKQYVPLRGRPMLSWTLQALLRDESLAGLMVALAPNDEYWPTLEEAKSPRVRTCIGGERREVSVARALEALAAVAAPTDWVLVHDAARPCLRREDLQALCTQLEGDAVGGLLAAPASDTLKRADAQDLVETTVDRSGLWRALTPQMFRFGLLQRALALCAERGRAVTDEASAVECLGLRPRLVRGHADNLKVTDPDDAALAEAILRAHDASYAARASA